MAVRTLSICTGLGYLDHGLDLALGRAGEYLAPVCYVEREAYSAAHLVHQMEIRALAPAPIWSDVHTLTDPEIANLVASAGGIDLLAGGIPRQPYSQAGDRRGHADERDLWYPTRAAIAKYRPGVVYIENVSGFANARREDQGLGTVLYDLEALGYVSTAGLFTSIEAGAAHRRQRTFVLAYDCRNRLQGGWLKEFVDQLGARWDQLDRRDPDVADTSGNGTREQPRDLPQDEGEYDEREADCGDRHLASCDPLADPEDGDGRSGERQAQAGVGADSEWRLGLASERFRLPRYRYAPEQGDLAAWAAVARTEPDRLPALSRRETAEREVLRVADGDAPRSLQIRAVGNSVDPMVAALGFISLAAALYPDGGELQ